MDTSEQIQSATLIIWGGNFDPASVAQFMGVRPSQHWRQGEQKKVVLEDGRAFCFESRNEWSGWKLWLDEDTRKEPLEKQIRLLAGYLPGREHPLRQLREQGASITMDCYICVERPMTFSLPADLQALLGRFGVKMKSTCFYPRTGQAPSSGRAVDSSLVPGWYLGKWLSAKPCFDKVTLRA